MYLCIMSEKNNVIEKQDFRSASGEVRTAIRKRGISLLKSGKKKGEVALLFGVNKNTVSNWYRMYYKFGNKELVDKKRGARSEKCKLLSAKQEHLVQKMIVDKYPQQYKLSFSLWTRKAVK